MESFYQNLSIRMLVNLKHEAIAGGSFNHYKREKPMKVQVLTIEDLEVENISLDMFMPCKGIDMLEIIIKTLN